MNIHRHFFFTLVVACLFYSLCGVSTAMACAECDVDWVELQEEESDESDEEMEPTANVAPPDCEIDADCGPCGICDAEAFGGGWGYCYWEVWGDECEEEIVEPECHSDWHCPGCGLCEAGFCVEPEGLCLFDSDCGPLERCLQNFGDSCQNTCVPMTEHEALCASTGGDWNTCGACGPTTCESYLNPPEICPAVCISMCACPADAPIWDGEYGCVSAAVCDAGDGIKPVVGVTLGPGTGDGNDDVPGRGCSAAGGPFGSTALLLALCGICLAVMRRQSALK